MNITEDDVLGILEEIATFKPKKRRVADYNEVGINVVKKRAYRGISSKENSFTITCYTRDLKNNEVVAERRILTTNDDGTEVYITKDMVYTAATMQAAEALAIRKVYDHPYVHRAVFSANRLKKKDGSPFQFEVDRNTAVAHFLQRDKYRKIKKK